MFHTYDTSALKSSAWDFIFFHSLWLCADRYCTQTVPLHRHLGSWKQCMRFNFMPTFTPWGLCVGLCCLQAVTPWPMHRTPRLLRALHEISSSYNFYSLVIMWSDLVAIVDDLGLPSGKSIANAPVFRLVSCSIPLCLLISVWDCKIWTVWFLSNFWCQFALADTGQIFSS